MRKVLLYTILLLIGLIGSQVIARMPGSETLHHIIMLLTMTTLSFIMIHVGYEFDLDKSDMRQYGKDYGVAFTAAAFPWIFVSMYFVFVLLPPQVWGEVQTWKETLLAGRFASPTSAGVLFSMLAAAGLSLTWVFRKARVLAIFDDVDTVLLMIPLKMLMVGFAWQLGVAVLLMMLMLWAAWRFLYTLQWRATWPWVMSYAFVITALSEIIYQGSLRIDAAVPIHIEVLLPAFVLGCMLAPPHGTHPEIDDAVVEHPIEHADKSELLAQTIISAVFMLLVGLNMPLISAASPSPTPEVPSHPAASPVPGAMDTITAAQPGMSWGLIILHVLAVTLLSNLGKMFPAFCYRNEASFRERLAVAIAMWPRGEVGAGVLVVSLSYGIGGPILTIALLSLALNLACTGFIILWVKSLLRAQHQAAEEQAQVDPSQRPALQE